RQVEDIPDAYNQMVKSLITGKPISAENGTIDRNTVTDTQASSNRIEADQVWYLRLGYGAIPSGGFSAGPTFGWGFRRELDKIAIDGSFLDTTLGRRDGSYENFLMSLVKLEVLYYFDPLASNSPYAGGGLSWGFARIG